MVLNYIPTRKEVELTAISMFPGNLELQSNFIVAVYMTIYESKIEKNEQ